MVFELRPATQDDAGLVADLETDATPDNPRDAEMVRYWWTHTPEAKHATRLLADNMYFSAWHGDWKPGARRYGMVHIVIHPSAWSPNQGHASLQNSGRDARTLSGGSRIPAPQHESDLGRTLLKDAFLRAARAASEVGMKAVLVDAIDEESGSFYERFGFEQSPTDPLQLFLPMAVSRASIEAAARLD